MKHFLPYLLMALCLMTSCVTTRKVNYMQEPDKQIPSYADTVSYADYEIRYGDRLYVYVYSIDETIGKLLNAGQSSTNRNQFKNGSGGSSDLYTYLVDDEGFINFPTLGKVQVHGMTTRDVKHELEDQLRSVVKQQGAMPNISVEVSIVQRTFSVIGANSSGRFTIPKEKVTIFEALAMAGDIADFGKRSEVKIIREVDGETKILTFDVRSKDIINSEFYYIEPNDVIYVRKITGQSFGWNNVSAVISTVATTLSFGVFVYTLVQTGLTHVNNKKNGVYNK